MSKIKIFALGGQNEIGKNMYVVEVDKKIYIFEAGLKYADDKLLGVDYIIPNYDYLIENRKRIQGIFITHGHEEQTGALADILVDIPDIKIYAGKFTLEIIKQDLEESGIKNAKLIEVKAHKKINFENETVFPIQVSHALPDSYLYILNTSDGAIVFSGSYIFDPSMMGPYSTDIGRLAYVGKMGVLCLMNESLYADKIGYTSPNHRASSVIRNTIDENDGRIFFNIFENQIYRIQELFNEIENTDRNVVIMGKRLEGVILKAIDMNYVHFDKKRIKSIHHVNDEKIVVIVSDEREKPFSNLKRILRGYDKFIEITNEDTIVFASPIYDGMERTATKLFDTIARMGANVIEISRKQFPTHHASSEDLMLMLDLINPKYYMPVIGEYRHQVANANVAKRLGMKEEDILLKLNGEVAYFENGKLVDNGMKIPVDDILIDGLAAGDVGELVIKDRELLSDNGIVIITATLDKGTKEVLAGPEVLTRGFIFVKDNIDLIKEAEKISLNVIKENTKTNYVDFTKIKSGIRDKVGKYFYEQTECKPMVLIVIGEV